MSLDSLSTACALCLHESIIPIKLQCNHTFCFLCLIYNFLTDQIICQCDNNNIANSAINCSNTHVWLYSSNYNGLWWCYTNEQNAQIEYIYKDHLKMDKSHISKDADEYIQIHIPSASKTKNIRIKSKNSYMSGFSPLAELTSFGASVSQSPIEVNQEFINMEIKLDEDDQINFADPISHTQYTNKNVLSYNIQIGSNEYKIDFDTMRQINLSETFKKRNMRRLEISQNMSDTGTFINHLKSQNIIGIAGIKFK